MRQRTKYIESETWRGDKCQSEGRDEVEQFSKQDGDRRKNCVRVKNAIRNCLDRRKIRQLGHL